MSEVSICNAALAYLGELPIRSLEERTTSAGLCASLYKIVRNECLVLCDWSFASRMAKLSQIVEYHYRGAVFALPEDCLTPVKLFPKSAANDLNFIIEGARLVIPGTDSESKFPIGVWLKYTREEDNTSIFTPSFSALVSLDLAVRLCMPLTQDSKLQRQLDSRLAMAKVESTTESANRGEDFIRDQAHDTFLNLDERICSLDD